MGIKYPYRVRAYVAPDDSEFIGEEADGTPVVGTADGVGPAVKLADFCSHITISDDPPFSEPRDCNDSDD